MLKHFVMEVPTVVLQMANVFVPNPVIPITSPLIAMEKKQSIAKMVK